MKQLYINGKYEADFACGNVCRVSDVESGSDILLKRWHAEEIRGANEASALKEISCDGVPELIECCEDGGYFYLARRWVDGVTLDEYMSTQKELDVDNMISIVCSLCQLLAKIEASVGVYLHGDIKPTNVLYSESDKQVSLIDFETFTLMKNITDTEIKGLKNTGGYTVSLASEGFSAPEIYDGKVCVESDIYSIGKLIAYLFRLCDIKGNMYELYDASAPKDIVDIVKKCIVKSPGKRYRNKTSLMNDVLHVKNVLHSQNIQCVTKPDETEHYCSKTILFETKVNEIRKKHINDSDLKRKKVIYIAGNTCFASEFSYVASACMGMKTVLFESDNGIGAGTLNYFIDRQNIGNVSCVSESSEPFFCDYRYLYSSDKSKWVSRGVLSESKKTENLLVSECNVFSEFGIVGENDLLPLLYWSKEAFDLTVISDTLNTGGLLESGMIKYADCVIVPVRPNIDEVYIKYRHYKWLCRKYGVPYTKLLFIAWEYEDNKSMSESDFKIAVEDMYGGIVRYDSERLKSKNVMGDFYCEKFKNDMENAYKNIISKVVYR